MDMLLGAEGFRALGDPVRLGIVRFLLDQGGVCCATPGRVCACDIVAKLSLSQPTVSHHMQILTRAGLVSAEKQGRWMFYSANPQRFAALAAQLQAVADATRLLSAAA
jgi:ArsR family transcriptional regulator